MKKSIFMIVVLILSLVSLVASDLQMQYGSEQKEKTLSGGSGIGVFVNYNTNCIQFIDPENFKVYDPIPIRKLGIKGEMLLDVAITSDGKTAIVSDFGAQKIFFIDISEGSDPDPTLLGSVRLLFPAEDIDITPDDKYVLVTDGGFSGSIAVVNIATRTLVRTINMSVYGRYALAVAVAPDGQTVIAADWLFSRIYTLLLFEQSGRLVFKYKKTYPVPPVYPINIAISPDGRTVIVVALPNSVAPIFTLDSPGQLTFVKNIALPASGGQSCVFSKDGKKAYYLTNGNPGKGTQVHILDVTGPGQVSASGASISVTPMRGAGGYFGIDTIALDPDGKYLYVTNPTPYPAIAGVSILDLTPGVETQVDLLPTFGFPAGIAFATKR